MANIFTSDLHFFHSNVVKFTGRPWTQEENTEKLVELWNNEVGEGDTIWHLGDFFFLGSSWNHAQKAVDVLNRLNGEIRCVQGNHDPSKLWERIFQNESLEKTITLDKMKEIKLNKTKLVLCHYPMVVWNQSHRGAIQLHGHCHGSLHNLGKSIDVGLDGASERIGGWKFWTEHDVLSYAEHLEIHSPDHHEVGGRG